MPGPRKTQKEISQRYAGNLLYNKFFSPLRGGRKLLGLAALLVGILVAAAYLHYGRTTPQMEWFNSPGGISQAHAGFARDCKQCHEPGQGGDPLRLSMTSKSIDASCLNCHAQHTFHQADVTTGISCVACHHEHLGTGPMPPVADVNCRVCHASVEMMAASAKKAAGLPPQDFQLISNDNLVFFHPPRPPEGYTRVIHSFEGDHPDFQIQREHLTDSNTLKFSHETHLTGAIPEINGHKLNCAFCHQPDSRGAYMQPISFARNCQACHALQLDATLPGFQLPHPQPGSPSESVRDFILTLPTQYTAYAVQHMQELHISEPSQITDFVRKHMELIRQRTRQGDDLVKDAFYADARQVNLGGPGQLTAPERALFPGCAYCHEVKTSASGEPVVTSPVTPDRWYVHARFDHASHKTVSCEECHNQMLHSERTTDILLPDKASCVTCHSAKGGAVSTCVTCHGYHNTDRFHDGTNAPSLRKMMLPAP